MYRAKEYILYTRSRAAAFLLLLFYLFCSFALLVVIVALYPHIRDRYVGVLLLVLPALSVFFTRLTTRAKIKITLHDNYLEIAPRRYLLFSRQPERSILFERISSFKYPGNGFTINIKDGTSLALCERRIFFGKPNALQQFIDDFLRAHHQWQPGSYPKTPIARTQATTSPLVNTSVFEQEVSTGRSKMFYAAVISIGLILSGMGLLLIVIAVDEKEITMALLALGVLLANYYMVSRYYRTTPIIRCSRAGISFNKQFYAWNEVTAVELTGSQPFKVYYGSPMEGASMEFLNGEKRYMLDALYSGLSRVRSFIYHTIPGKVIVPSVQEQKIAAEATNASRLEYTGPYTPPTVGADDAEYVKGNPYFNGWAIFMWACLLFLTGIAPFLVTSGDDLPVATGAFFMIAVGVYFLFSINFDYFGLSGQFLIVKNAYLPWKKKMYPLSDIRELLFATTERGPDVLRIIFADFKTKQFRAAGLRNRDWITLMALIQSHDIPLKDENSVILWSTPEMKKGYRKMVWYFVLYFLVCLISFGFILCLDVSETAMIFLKIGWFIFIALSFIGLIKLIVWEDAKEQKKDLEKEQK